MSLDPTEKGYHHKKKTVLELVNLTEAQAQIVDIYLMEELTGKRHWEWDPREPDIYMEWMNGTQKLRNRINILVNMSKRQKATYNMENQINRSNNGNTTQIGKDTLTTSSGRTITRKERPDLFKPRKRR